MLNDPIIKIGRKCCYLQFVRVKDICKSAALLDYYVPIMCAKQVNHLPNLIDAFVCFRPEPKDCAIRRELFRRLRKVDIKPIEDFTELFPLY